MTSTYTRIHELLTQSKRRAALVLLGLIIVGTVLEILGIGLLLPVISLLMSDDLASSYPVLQPVLNALGNPDHAPGERIGGLFRPLLPRQLVVQPANGG